MAAISETLRQARLRSGVDLERLADKTKINIRYLRAIEAGDFGELPSGIFARMFIKQYADAIGLDGASFAEEFQRISAFGNDAGPSIETIAATRHSYQPSVPGISTVGDRVRSERIAGMLSSLIWVVAAILVCAGAYYGLAHLPSRSTVVSGSSDSASTPASTAPASTPGKGSVPTPPATTPAPPVVVTPATPIQLVVHAVEPVWLTANADGKTVFSELVPAGANRTVIAKEYARLTLGNAGGAEIAFNGKKLEPIGLKGQVRTMEFTPQGPQVAPRAQAKGEAPAKGEPPVNPDPLR